MKAKQLRELTDMELKQKMIDIKKEIFNLRIQQSTGKSGGNVKRIRNLRKDIARILTILNERKRSLLKQNTSQKEL